jgi:hypothetical protein
MEKKKEKTSSTKFAEDWLPIVDIKNGMIEVENPNPLVGLQYVTGVRIEPRNIFISDQQTQDNVIYNLRNFYNTIDYEFWLICCDRPVDINLYKSELEIMYTKEKILKLENLLMKILISVISLLDLSLMLLILNIIYYLKNQLKIQIRFKKRFIILFRASLLLV